ncbi:TonB-dependent receptor [Gracilimonas mengyeensis]|uniref:TonB-dependent receptor n=1 Tax=Gracilimonas mengyeensis TaxID=1302730 RepID=UPI001C8F2D3F|nr:TonB-dependent receptor [Gracilimonas mengyeensis]
MQRSGSIFTKDFGSALRLIGRSFFSIQFVGAVLFVMMLCTASVFAQNGTIRGEVKEAETGEALIGANVILQGTSKGASTDIDGRYVIRNVSPEEYTLIFRYLGFESKDVQITVEAGQTLTQNMEMSATTVQGEEIQITAQQRGQARALSEQRKSVNIKNVISSEQIESFADNTVTDALSRISGMGHGGTNIRGVGAGSANVTMDGQRMGATGGNRSVDLSTISSDMVQDLEVIKVITPDMDADALAGVININTRRPVGGERDLNIRLGGGLQDRYVRHMGTNRRASISYGDSPSDTYSFGLNFSYQRDPSANEVLRTEWGGQKSFEGYGPMDRLANLGTELNFSVPQRIGTGLQFTFQPSEVSTYHVQGMFNVQNRTRYQYALSYNPRLENYIENPFYTGFPDGGGGPDAENQGTMSYSPRMDEATIHQYTVQAGGRHRLDNMDIEYKLGWGHGRFNDDQYRMSFETRSRQEFIFDLEDRWNPSVEIAPWSRNPSYPEPSQMVFQDMDHRINSNVDNDFEASIDFEVPHRWGEFKFGSSSSLTYKRGIGERLLREYSSNLDVSKFQQIENGSWQIFNRAGSTYQIPWLIDLEKARDFYITQTPRFQTDLEEWALSTETSDYFANENTYAAYVMGNFEVEWFTVLGGLRVEHTFNKYEGRESEISQSGIFRGASDISNSNSYTNFFPNLQTVFSLGDLTNVRFAYSRSIGRPSFSQLNPYIQRNYSTRTIQRGNPDLDPMLSNNFDILFEHYFMNVGQFTVGLFYKDMKDFVFSSTEIVDYTGDNEEGLTGRWTVDGFKNGEEAKVYGAEISWQQKLEFLPGRLGNLATYSNYSYAQSIADVGRQEEQSTHGLAEFKELLGMKVDPEYKYVTPLEGQRPHVINAGLEYSEGDFFAQVSYQWAANALSSYAGEQTAIALPQPEEVYLDQYNDAAQDLSLTVRYWINSSFQIWFDASNILNNKEFNYYYDADYYPYTTELDGREITLGLRYRL